MIVPLSWSRMKVSKTVRCPLTIHQADLDAFARLSGDFNPLHLDGDYARKYGFEGRVVYGGLLVAAVSRLLGMKLPGGGCLWQSLSLQFTAPLYVGDRASVIGKVIYANPELSVLRISIEVRAKGRLIARGQAQASVLK